MTRVPPKSWAGRFTYRELATPEELEWDREFRARLHRSWLREKQRKLVRRQR